MDKHKDKHSWVIYSIYTPQLTLLDSIKHRAKGMIPDVDLCTWLLPGTAGLSSPAGHAVGQAPGDTVLLLTLEIHSFATL